MFRQDQDRWLAELATLPLAHQPGERLTYSHSTDVLGIALSRIEGKPLAEVLAERVFEPLGMADTGFSVSQDGRRRAATMYKLDANNTLRRRRDGTRTDHAPTFCMGGAGLWSTADDYLAFARMLLGGRHARRRSGAVGRVRAADAHRPADRRAEEVSRSLACRSGAAADSG